MTLVDLVQKSRRGDVTLTEFARELMREADEEWEHACARLDDVTGAHHAGKAHALCRVLGDQDAL